MGERKAEGEHFKGNVPDSTEEDDIMSARSEDDGKQKLV
jgi:hypothetical protein